jgi:type IV pilus assembly protein PilB
MLRQLGVEPAAYQGRPFYSGAGCPVCYNTGYKGRLGIFEFLQMTDPLREMVVAGASLVEVRQKAVAGGMTGLRDAGLAAILAGDTTVEEIVKYT